MKKEDKEMIFLTRLPRQDYESNGCFTTLEGFEGERRSDEELRRPENFIERRMSEIRRIFERCNVDERLAKMARDIMEGGFDIKGRMPGKFGAGCNYPINTIPFGVPTDRYYPFLLVTCFGSDGLRRRLEQIIAHVKGSENSECPTREVLLMTSKWNENIFSEYRQIFENMIRMGIRITIILSLPKTVVEIPV